MGNHLHLVPDTRQANLSRLMRHINGVYSQLFNRRHGLVGYLLQCRFKAILVDRARTCWPCASMSSATRWLRASWRSRATGPGANCRAHLV
jgi:hypothetical protein